jgi:ankyrin repeat protein
MLPAELLQLTASFLEIPDVLHMAECCKYFNNEIVWGPGSAALLWGEMDRRTINHPLCNHIWTPLMLASRIAPVQNVKTLIVAKADVNYENCDGDMAIHHAISHHNDVDVIRLILDNTSRHQGLASSLICAASSDNVEVVRLLINEYHVDVETRDTCGDTALLSAVRSTWNCVDVARVLIEEFEADPNARSECPALFHALYNGLDMVRLLVNAHADVGATCRGQTLSSYAHDRCPHAHDIHRFLR